MLPNNAVAISVIIAAFNVAAETRGTLVPDVQYLVHFKLADGSTPTCALSKEGIRQGRATYLCQLDTSNLNRPAVVGFEAEATRIATLDRSGRHFAILR